MSVITVCRPGEAGYIQPGSDAFFTVLGCSEVADVLGFGYKSAVERWKIKTHRMAREDHKSVFDRGHDMEPIMSRMIQRDHGRVLVSEQVQYRDPTRPWLVYHADGMFPSWTPLNEGAKEQAGPGIWEAKAPGSRMCQKMAEEGVTENYVCQGQIGMHVAGAALDRIIGWGTYGFLDYDAYELECYDTLADISFQQRALQMLDRFWDCVVRDVPPEDVEAEKVVLPELTSTKQIVTDPTIVQEAVLLAQIMADMKPLEKQDKEIRARMKEFFATVSEAEIPGVMKFTYRYQKEGENIDGEGLLHYCESLCEANSIPFRRTDWVTPKAPTRVFKPTPIKQKK